MQSGLFGKMAQVFSSACDTSINASQLPDEFDWRDNNGVTPVRNQKHCGSCYIFSALGALESQYLLHKNQSIDLSEQALVNCIPTGCNGGWMNWVWDYIQKNGVPLEEEVPYADQVHIESLSQLSS